MSLEYRLVCMPIQHTVHHDGWVEYINTCGYLLQSIGETGVWKTCELIEYSKLPKDEQDEIQRSLLRFFKEGKTI